MSDRWFAHDDEKGLVDLRRRVVQARESGRATIELRRLVLSTKPGADLVATAFVNHLKLQPPPAWTELDATEALDAATRVLHVDLAFKSPVMPIESAKSLARTFLGFFQGGATFLTNGSLAATGTGAWSPLTRATFDTGIVAIGPSRVGLLWVEDED